MPHLETAAGKRVYPVAPQPHLGRGGGGNDAAADFPAILQNSMDKLQMNFLQNKSISAPAPLEYQVSPETGCRTGNGWKLSNSLTGLSSGVA